MKKIERPDFEALDDNQIFKSYSSLERGFYKWFDAHIKDCYVVREDELVRVYGPFTTSPIESDSSYTHIAQGNSVYLIKSSIEPIKKCEHRPCHHARCLGALICEKCGAKLKPTSWETVDE